MILLKISTALPQYTMNKKYTKPLFLMLSLQTTSYYKHPKTTRIPMNHLHSHYTLRMKMHDRNCTNLYPFIFMATHWSIGIQCRTTSWLPSVSSLLHWEFGKASQTNFCICMPLRSSNGALDMHVLTDSYCNQFPEISHSQNGVSGWKVNMKTATCAEAKKDIYSGELTVDHVRDSANTARWVFSLNISTYHKFMDNSESISAESTLQKTYLNCDMK